MAAFEMWSGAFEFCADHKTDWSSSSGGQWPDPNLQIKQRSYLLLWKLSKPHMKNPEHARHVHMQLQDTAPSHCMTVNQLSSAVLFTQHAFAKNTVESRHVSVLVMRYITIMSMSDIVIVGPSNTVNNFLCILIILFPSTGHNAQQLCKLRQRRSAHSDVNKHGWEAHGRTRERRSGCKRNSLLTAEWRWWNDRNAAVTPETPNSCYFLKHI